nr:hypothetical protein [Tanacetum cinerariifolium]
GPSWGSGSLAFNTSIRPSAVVNWVCSDVVCVISAATCVSKVLTWAAMAELLSIENAHASREYIASLSMIIAVRRWSGLSLYNQYVLFPLWSSGSKDPQKTDDDATFEVKKPEFEVEKPESEVYVSPSSSAKTKKHDDKTKRDAKGKSHVELLTGYRNLSEEFKDFSDNSINEVNVASTLVPAVGQISTNSTNTFSAAVLLILLLDQHMKNLHMWILLNTPMI